MCAWVRQCIPLTWVFQGGCRSCCMDFTASIKANRLHSPSTGEHCPDLQEISVHDRIKSIALLHISLPECLKYILIKEFIKTGLLLTPVLKLWWPFWQSHIEKSYCTSEFDAIIQRDMRKIKGGRETAYPSELTVCLDLQPFCWCLLLNPCIHPVQCCSVLGISHHPWDYKYWNKNLSSGHKIYVCLNIYTSRSFAWLHIMQAHCGYCKLEQLLRVCWGYSAATALRGSSCWKSSKLLQICSSHSGYALYET